MVKVNYIGLGDGKREFADLREAHQKLHAMQRRCKPLGDDYEAIGRVLHALKDAATHFTKDPYFYGGGPH